MKTIRLNENEPGKYQLATEQAEPRQPAQQKTISHTSPLNHRFARNIQLSDRHLMVKRYNCPTVAFDLDALVALAVMAEPKLTWPPLFTAQPPGVVEAAENGSSPVLRVETASELPVSYQWQRSGDDGNTWADMPEEKTAMVCAEPGLYRCLAGNASGTTASLVILVNPKAEAKAEGNPT